MSHLKHGKKRAVSNYGSFGRGRTGRGGHLEKRPCKFGTRDTKVIPVRETFSDGSFIRGDGP